MPDGIGFIGIIVIVFAGLLSFLAYKFGRVQEKFDCEKEKSETLARVRSLRCQLNDPDTVKCLHETFKR